MLIAWFAIIVMIVGLLLWSLSANAKLQKIGYTMFVVGLAGTVLAAGPSTTIRFP